MSSPTCLEKNVQAVWVPAGKGRSQPLGKLSQFWLMFVRYSRDLESQYCEGILSLSLPDCWGHGTSCQQSLY